MDVEAERVTGAELPEVVISQVSAENSSTIISPVKQGETYRVRIRIRNTYSGAQSVWVYFNPHTVIGKTEPPPDVSDLTLKNGALSWLFPTKQEVPDWLVLF